MELSLDCAEKGKAVTVCGVDGPQDLVRRLKHFGLVPGTRVSVGYRSPDGSVTALKLRGTVIALRTADLRGIRGFA